MAIMRKHHKESRHITTVEFEKNELFETLIEAALKSGVKDGLYHFLKVYDLYDEFKKYCEEIKKYSTEEFKETAD